MCVCVCVYVYVCVCVCMCYICIYIQVYCVICARADGADDSSATGQTISETEASLFFRELCCVYEAAQLGRSPTIYIHSERERKRSRARALLRV